MSETKQAPFKLGGKRTVPLGSYSSKALWYEREFMDMPVKDAILHIESVLDDWAHRVEREANMHAEAKRFQPPMTPLKPATPPEDLAEKFLDSLGWEPTKNPQYSWVRLEDADEQAQGNAGVVLEWFDKFEAELRTKPNAGVFVGRNKYTLSGEGFMFLGRTTPKQTRTVEATPQ